ncbi:MAG: LptF/LptG family permease [Fimbriimonadaceae bacterium]|nr:LptF/LptG family permease [Fimbriimonadaceae bacterium]
MKRLDRYLFTEVAAPFVLAQTIFIILFMGTEAMTEAVKLISRFGLPWFEVIKLLLLRMPWALAWTLPMSTGMAVIVALGRLCKDHEYVAMIVGGVSFNRVMRPMLLFASLVTALALYVQEIAGPATMMRYHVNKLSLQNKSRTDINEVHYRLTKHDDARRVTLTAERLDTRDKVLETVQISLTEEHREKARISARRGEWNEKIREWDLIDGRYTFYRGQQTVDGVFDRTTVTDLARQAGYTGTIVFESSPNEVAVYGTDKPDYLVGGLIRKRIAWMRQEKHEPREVNRVVVYLHKRYTLATSCFLFVLIGAPLAVQPQRGASKSRPVIISLALIASYYIAWQSISLLGEGSRYPVLMSWSTNLVGVAIGAFLWRRVAD